MSDRIREFLDTKFRTEKDIFRLIDYKRMLEAKGEFYDAFEKNGIAGISFFEYKPFESDIFKIKIGSISNFLFYSKPESYSSGIKIRKKLISDTLKRQKKYKYIYSKVDIEDVCSINAFESKGFVFLNGNVDLLCDAKRISSEKTSGVELCSEKDVVFLEKIALDSFNSDRYHSELIWKSSKADFLHRLWVRNCFYNKLADRIFVYRVNGNPVGFNACKIEKVNDLKYGKIVLIGISKEFQGKGIGRTLIKAGNEWLLSSNVDCIIVRTETKNYPAIKAYQKENFVIAASSVYMRKYRV